MMWKKNEASESNRRDFLKGVALTGGAAMLAGSGMGLMAQATPKVDPKWKNQIGLELFTVNMRQDYEGALKQLAAIGYKEVEPADPYNNMEPKAYKALLDKYGIKMPSTHSGARDGADLEKQLAGFQEMGLLYCEVSGGGRGGPGGAPGAQGAAAGGRAGAPVGAAAGGRGAAGAGRGADAAGGAGPAGGAPGGPGGPGEPGGFGRGGPGLTGPVMRIALANRSTPQSVESVKTRAAEMNKYGAITKKFGMKILVHNHTGEFELLDDGRSTQHDVVIAETDPDLVTMQLDIGWASVAGQNILELFARNPGRYELWHVKDIQGLRNMDPSWTPSQRQPFAHIVPIGVGEIDYRTIFAAAPIAGLKHFVVEQDGAGAWGDEIAACRVSYNSLHGRILA